MALDPGEILHQFIERTLSYEIDDYYKVAHAMILGMHLQEGNPDLAKDMLSAFLDVGDSARAEEYVALKAILDQDLAEFRRITGSDD